MNLKNIFKIEIDQNRVFGLDVLRAVAILLVVISHSFSFLPGKISSLINRVMLDGVGIFFILSGFLIGKILIQTVENTSFTWKDVKIFWYKRWSRTLPNYYFFLILIGLINYQTVLKIGGNVISYFLFLQNIDHNPQFFFGWSWSLSVEEWFYIIAILIIWGLIYIFPKIRKKNIILSSIVILIFLPNIFRFLFCIENGYSVKVFDILQYFVLYRLDTIIYGVLGAYLLYYHKNFWENKRKIFLFIGILLCILLLVLNLQKYNDDYQVFSCLFLFPINSISVLLFMPFFNNVKKAKKIFIVPITYISLISYSLYLINGLIADLLIEVWHNKELLLDKFSISLRKEYLGGILFFLFWIISFFLATLQYKYFEIKATNYLRRYV